LISYKLYAITDRSWLAENESLAEAVEDAILGGATIIQLREKHLDYNELRELALSVQKVCQKYNVPFIINDNVELAAEIDADGVHVGQSDTSVEKARKILGPDKIVGATAKTVEQAKTAEAQGADYLGSGAVFGTTTKLDAKFMTMELLKEITASVNIPVVAIGGITAENVGKLRGSQIAGPAVVSGIFAKKNKCRAAQNIISNFFGRPVIQCITNHVTVNSVANMVLACGASPIMAHNIREVAEVQENAAGLLLNLGATDDYEAMKIAYAKALELGHPVVIDPVGVSAIGFRRSFLAELLEIGSPSCIRGNYAEIRAIYENRMTATGLEAYEAVHESGKLNEGAIDIEEAAIKLAERLCCIVVASGEKDIITDGNTVVYAESGHPMQKSLTGSGCMLSAAIISEIARNADSFGILQNAVMTCRRLGDAAAAAAEQIIKEEKGIFSFQSLWFDLI